MSKNSECNIVSVGKRRDGGTRFWCLLHRADATAKYGVEADRCRYATVAPLLETEQLTIDISHYPGGVALWGAVPAIYDTSTQPLDRGIHVHARMTAKREKTIDKTFRKVLLRDSNSSSEIYEASELDAIYYMVTSIFGFKMKYVQCGKCGYPHLDKDWFSLHPHQRHLCSGCGQYFRDDERGIGNPLVGMQAALGSSPQLPTKINRRLEINQRDYPGGIQIWGSNPSIFWTSPQLEEDGIHLHAYCDDGSTLAYDDTFSEVIIDGVRLDPVLVRTLMAQKSLPHIAERVMSFSCPKCENSFFGKDELAFSTRSLHFCDRCGNEFQRRGRLRNVIGNPLVEIFSVLARSAPRQMREHDIGLLPETI
jgi:predicted nucleic-acid-binding Zn-ribbon protein